MNTRLLTTIAALFLFLLGMRVQAAAPQHTHLPTIGNQAQPSVNLTKMVDQDCGFVEAWPTDDGRIFVAYQTRPSGTVYLAEDKGDYLAKIDIPPVGAPPIIQPGADDGLPGPKQGSVSLFERDGVLYIYYTGRAEGDLTGPFYLWRLTMPVPAVGT